MITAAFTTSQISHSFEEEISMHLAIENRENREREKLTKAVFLK